MATHDEMTLPEAAMALRAQWKDAWRLLLTQKLDGRKGANGRWVVTRASVERLRAEREAAQRTPVAATA